MNDSIESYEEIYKKRCHYLTEKGFELTELNKYENFQDIMEKNIFLEIKRKVQNRKNKRYRTKNKFLEIYRIKNLIKNDNKKIVFGTITLDNKHLNQKEDTYIRKINKWLKKHFIYTILNKDFGSKTEREHYHFIGLTIEEIKSTNRKSKKGYEIFELKNKDYEMGFEPSLCMINLNENDIKKTVNYLLKLNNHSHKTTTKNRIRIIKNKQYEYLVMITGFDATKAEKRAKKRLLDNM